MTDGEAWKCLASLPFHETPLTRAIEAELKIDLPTYVTQAYYVAGLTQEQIANELGVGVTTINLWMRQLKLPTFMHQRREAFERTRSLLEQ